MTKVSVIIPYYKKKKYILATLNSVIKQSYKNLEIIIVFDEENKKNLKFISSLAKKDRRIKLIVNKKNLGAGLSRNVAIKKSKGEYIAFIDADDLWNENKIQIQVNFMKSNKIKVSHTSYVIINEKNFTTGVRQAKNYLSIDELMKSCDIGLSTVMVKRKILTKNLNFAKLKTKEDFVLWLKLVKKKIRIYAISKKLTKWRKTENSLSSSSFQKIIDGFRVYNTYLGLNFFLSSYFLFILSFNYIIKKIND